MIQTINHRIIYIDVIKGLGILFVMFNHFGLTFSPVSEIISAGYMAWFFILSGITYRSKYDDLRTKIIVKFKRLIIPYFFYGIIFTLLDFILCKSIKVNSIIGLIYSRFMLYKDFSSENIYFLNSYVSPLWFLTAMFISYILFFIYERYRMRIRIVLFFIYIFISMLLSCIPILFPWSIDTSFLGAAFIIIGHELKALFNSQYNNNLFNVLLLLLLIILTLYNGDINMSIRDYGLHSCFSIINFLLIGFISCYLLRSLIIQFNRYSYFIKLTSLIGHNSLRLMCIHMFCINSFYSILSRILLMPYSFNIIMSIILTILLCSFLNYLFKFSIFTKYRIFRIIKYI